NPVNESSHWLQHRNQTAQHQAKKGKMPTPTTLRSNHYDQVTPNTPCKFCRSKSRRSGLAVDGFCAESSLHRSAFFQTGTRLHIRFCRTSLRRSSCVSWKIGRSRVRSHKRSSCCCKQCRSSDSAKKKDKKFMHKFAGWIHFRPHASRIDIGKDSRAQ